VVQELRHALTKSHHRQPVALVIVDFSNVQGIVDGDEAMPAQGDLLMRLGKLMRTNVPSQYFVGHLRNREFAVILTGASISEVEHIADQIIESVRKEDSLEDERRYIATIVGIGYSSKGEGKAPHLMTLADIALHYALATGRGTHTIVDRVQPARAA
jgi:GGDEF domain-containing protein